MTNSIPTNSIRALLTEIIDYAGLFPPSNLSMPEAVINYATYKNSNYNWMLGRFIVPVNRLDEFSECGKDFFPRDKNGGWRLSVLASEDIHETIRAIEDFNARHTPGAVCDTLEVKAATSSQIEEISEVVPSNIPTYFEIPLGEDLADLVATLAIYNQRAKIRTGGITADAFPKIEKIVRFMRACLAANVPFKTTAGLHHPMRCFKSLTYERDAPEGTMNGFLNVFLATGFLRQGYKPSLIYELLEEESAESFLFDAGGVLWRQEYFISTAQLRHLREKNIVSFGSCSFDEPIADLQEIGIL
ncbi:MAG: hypothetical protein H0W58_13785 [Acidobacteria bacterium]|jgi:hypothetical protein|nr:hypothetical protein [Acidobacteriota bacterium]